MVKHQFKYMHAYLQGLLNAMHVHDAMSTRQVLRLLRARMSKRDRSRELRTERHEIMRDIIATHNANSVTYFSVLGGRRART